MTTPASGSQDALDWYESPAYRALRDLRQGAADAVVLLADGAEQILASL